MIHRHRYRSCAAVSYTHLDVYKRQVLGVYIGTIVLLNIPNVQRAMSMFIAKELSEVLNTRLTIGKINIGLLNRIIIDDVLLDDQSGKEMLKVTRLSAKFDILPFFKEKISISSVQLFGFTINLNKETPDLSLIHI